MCFKKYNTYEKITIIALCGLAILLSSCGASIKTSVSKTYTPLKPNAHVEVYKNKKEIPAETETLGSVKVGDSGFTTNCDSITVIESMKTESRKIGGNAIFITEHKKPSFWSSSCHRMADTILRISDFNGQPMQNTEIIDLEIVKMQLPKFSVYANGGFGWRTAKIAEGLHSLQKDLMTKLKSGYTFDAGFEYFFDDNWGIGLNYAGYFTTLAHQVVMFLMMLFYL